MGYSPDIVRVVVFFELGSRAGIGLRNIVTGVLSACPNRRCSIRDRPYRVQSILLLIGQEVRDDNDIWFMREPSMISGMLAVRSPTKACVTVSIFR